MQPKAYDLEDRLVRFAGDIIIFCKGLPKDEVGINLSKQMTRSATSAALNFGEVQGAESTKDEIHKLGIVLKELKESRVNLKLCTYLQFGNKENGLHLLQECEELIAIIARIRLNKRGQ